MTATVRDLLDAIHAGTWGLCTDEPAPGVLREDRAAGFLAAWPRLARTTVRALDAVPLPPGFAGDVAVVRECLVAVANVGRRWRDPGWSDPAVLAPNAELVAIATRVGLIADLLTGQPKAFTDVDQVAAVGVQTNLLAPVYALATTTLAALEGMSGVVEARWLLRHLAARAEPYALVPPADRVGRYDDVAATRPREVSLDSCIARWAPATVKALGSRQQVTSLGLQVAAGDTLILTAAAGTVCTAALKLGLVDAASGEAALAAVESAHQAWRSAAQWPTSIRLDGARQLEQVRASRELRQLITDTMRAGRAWLPAQALHDRLDLRLLLGTMRRGLHAAGNVALAHYQASEQLVRGPGQLWIAAAAISNPALQSAEVIEAACRKGWVVMPRGEPAGERILDAAKLALSTTTIALAALDRTAARPRAAKGGDDGSLLLDHGRVIARARTAHGLVTAHGSPGARAERKVPPSLQEWNAPGPRR